MKKILFILFLFPILAFGQSEPQIKTSQINTTLPSDFVLHNNGKKFGADSGYFSVTQAPPSLSGGLLIVFGNSIGAGLAIPDTSLGFAHLLANQIGESIRNYSVSGSVMEKRTPNNPLGGYNMVDNMVNVPTYSAGTTKWLIIELGVNDWSYAGANYTPTNYTTDGTTVLNYITTTKGWPGNKIILVGINRALTSYYGTTGTGGGTITLANQKLFNTAIQNLATTFGATFIDTYAAFLKYGGDLLMTNNVHPNTLGHQLMANLIQQAIQNNTVYKKGQAIAANGNAEFNQIIYGNRTLAAPDSGFLVGVNLQTNKLNLVSNIPYQTIINYPYLKGGFIQTGNGSLPNSYTGNDFLFNQDTRLMSAFATNGGYYNWIKLCNSGAQMDFVSTFSNGAYRFYKNTSTLSFIINTDGSVTPLTDVVLNGGQSTHSDVGGIADGYFYPLDASNNTRIQNKYGIGRINFFSSNGSNGGAVETMSLWPTGELTLQKTTPVNNLFSKLNIYSNSEVLTLPRITNNGRDSLEFVSSATMTSFGSGYTSVPSVSITGGGGSGATAVANLSGSIINGVNITNKGTGYTSAPTISITGGGGSGAAATANISTTGNQGSVYYNLSTGNIDYNIGNSFIPLNGYSLLSTTSSINAKTTGTTALFTVPVGKTLTVTGVYVRCTAASAITVGASADVGDSGNGAASIYPNTAMTTLDTSGKVFTYTTGGVYQTVAAGNAGNFNINTAANGTSQTFTVTLIGIFQ